MPRLIMPVVICAIAIFLFGRGLQLIHAKTKPEGSVAALSGEEGGEDLDGPYEVVENWPKPLSQVPGHQGWTWGSVSGIFAESPNRVFIIQRGESPAVKRPASTPLPQFGPGLSFPVNGLPVRNASQGPVASPPGPEGSVSNSWKGQYGVDARWEDCLVVVNANGDIVERWTQWDSLFKHPHAIFINPYDAEKSVWVVDNERQVIFKFSNDGKKLLKTIGTLNESGVDENHFGGPTTITWLPDGTMFVGDGEQNARVVKFDNNGKYLLAWGQKGNRPHETRPGYFNRPHNVVADPVTRRVYVHDRDNGRTQVFDENGNFIKQWFYGPVSSASFLYLSADRHLWVSDEITSKILEYDMEGHLLYSWGTMGDWAGALWGVHGMSVDQEGNFYVAEINNGRAQKFRPKQSVNNALLLGQPVRAAWK